MANDKNKKSEQGKRDDESMDDFEARTKTMTDEERAALDSDDTSNSLEDTDSSKGD